jgi:predicted NAD/FAD-binding protein
MFATGNYKDILMKVAIVGSGYVGLVTGAFLSVGECQSNWRKILL